MRYIAETAEQMLPSGTTMQIRSGHGQQVNVRSAPLTANRSLSRHHLQYAEAGVVTVSVRLWFLQRAQNAQMWMVA